MSRFEVDSARVAQASTKVGLSVEQIRAEVQGMNHHLSDLQNSWQGSAAATFAGLMTDWSMTQNQVEASLDAITTALQQASQTYAEAEQQAANLFAH